VKFASPAFFETFDQVKVGVAFANGFISVNVTPIFVK
jgi:hypothetical protein